MKPIGQMMEEQVPAMLPGEVAFDGDRFVRADVVASMIDYADRAAVALSMIPASEGRDIAITYLRPIHGMSLDEVRDAA